MGTIDGLGNLTVPRFASQDKFTIDGNQSGAGQGDYTLSYESTLSDANQLMFRATSRSLSVGDILTVGGTNIALNGGTIKDTASAAVNSSLVLSGLTAITHTVLA